MAAKKKYDWDAIHGDFTRSNISLRDLAKKHGVKYSYLASKSSEQNWFEQRDTIQAQAREAVAQELAARTDEQNDALADITCKTVKPKSSGRCKRATGCTRCFRRR